MARHATDRRFRAQFHKTELCHHFSRGQCFRGARCLFAHGEKELRQVPSLTKTSICKAWSQGHCNLHSDQCCFAHGREELRRTEFFGHKQASDALSCISMQELGTEQHQITLGQSSQEFGACKQAPAIKDFSLSCGELQLGPSKTDDDTHKTRDVLARSSMIPRAKRNQKSRDCRDLENPRSQTEFNEGAITHEYECQSLSSKRDDQAESTNLVRAKSKPKDVIQSCKEPVEPHPQMIMLPVMLCISQHVQQPEHPVVMPMPFTGKHMHSIAKASPEELCQLLAKAMPDHYED